MQSGSQKLHRLVNKRGRPLAVHVLGANQGKSSAFLSLSLRPNQPQTQNTRSPKCSILDYNQNICSFQLT